ncbi:hypothetical protein [Brochothrix thermosphacta]|uniref:hypothetical protein n=1 Tax=Brochothrix thermosphacta TaxID=2756 RepID=UPI0009C0C3F2|nr:hypothetical protein [Brochothrix thermosphacta]
MSTITSNNIANSSGITDENISFSKTWCEKQVIKGFPAFVTMERSLIHLAGVQIVVLLVRQSKLLNMARNYPALRLLNQRICLSIYF